MLKWLLKLFAPTLRAITFSSNGEGVLEYDGKRIPCLGKPGEKYPVDQIIENIEAVQYEGDWAQAFKFRRWVSREFPRPNGGAVMLWAVKINGSKGIFIHEGSDTLAENGGPSEGCIHLGATNSENFYNWISRRVRLEVSYAW